jgi:hypothetical protein
MSISYRCILCYTLTSTWHCLLLQALDTFNTAVVSPIYYTMFTSLTILASVIMFKVTPLELNLFVHIIFSKRVFTFRFKHRIDLTR